MIREALTETCTALFGVEPVVDIERPEEQFGDWSSNVAMRLSKPLNRKPQEIAREIADQLQGYDFISSASVAGPGFINITLTDAALVETVDITPQELVSREPWVVEYSCPNYFKELHAGHLYNTILGDVIARLVERAGAKVFRTTFGGDVGLHVARALYGILDQHIENMSAVYDAADRSGFIAEHYIIGTKLHQDEATAKDDIEALNKVLYGIARQIPVEQTTYKFSGGLISIDDLSTLYFTLRAWSTEYMKRLYERIDVHPFTKYYPESATEATGIKAVEEGIGRGIFTHSDGAVVYAGEKVGLHTRVFLTKAGLPTYETKDIGVILMEKKDFNFARRILLTGNDQKEYMQVVWAAIDELDPGLQDQMTHICNGTIRFGDGKKMSSRLGNVTRAVDVLDNVRAEIHNDGTLGDHLMLGAVKYEFLKHRIGGDIAFDPEASVSLQGNSGPYLQYAHARASSILKKANHQSETPPPEVSFNTVERSMVRVMSMYPETVTQATHELSPHMICTYLYELAQTFNSFYEQEKVIGSPREKERLWIVQNYCDILRDGLNILGIHAPEEM